MRRCVLILVAAAICVGLAAPASALAGKTWVVKNAAGKKIGTAQRSGSTLRVVYGLDGVQCGVLSRNDDGSWAAAEGRPEDQGIGKSVIIGESSDPGSPRLLMNPYREDKIEGIVRKRERFWKVQRKVGRRTAPTARSAPPALRGWPVARCSFSVSLAASPPAAGGNESGRAISPVLLAGTTPPAAGENEG